MEVWGVQIMATVEEIIDHVKQEIDANQLGLMKDIKPTFNNIMVTCISHGDGQERNPSLGISLVEQVNYRGDKVPAGTSHCFTCGYKADLPTFISNVMGYNDRGMFGYRWLMRNYASVAVEDRKGIKLDMSRESTAEVTELPEIKEEDLEQYRYIHPYMEQRRLSEKVIDYFDVGFDKSNNAITFPVQDKEGAVRLIQRRSVQGKVFINDEGANKGEYLYGLYQVMVNMEWVKEVYVVESPIDALTLWKHRIPAIALMAARATMRQIELMKEIPLRKLILALDNDEAGQEGSKFIKGQLGKDKLIYRLHFPDGVGDVNDMTDEQIENREISIYH